MIRKAQPISGIKEGQRIEDIFVVKIKKSISPYAGGVYFNLLLSDAQGATIDYKYWGEKDEQKTRAIYNSINNDSVVFVQGFARSFMGSTQISTNLPDTISVLKEGEYDRSDFIKKSRRDIGEMETELKNYILSVNNADIKRVLEHIFLENTGFLEKFKSHPAAIEIHHNWTGGLLEHSLQMAQYCELSKKFFPQLDRDLMVAGCLLHDIGKLEELEITSRIKGTKKGQLIGHIAIGAFILTQAMQELKTPDEIANKLLHMLLSHQGRLDFGSPKEPMFPEAFAIYLADEMSSKLAEVTEFSDLARASTEDEFMYHKRKGRNIYLR